MYGLRSNLLLPIRLTSSSGTTWLGYPSQRGTVHSCGNSVVESYQHRLSDCLQHRHRIGRAWYHHFQHYRPQFDVEKTPDRRASPSFEVRPWQKGRFLRQHHRARLPLHPLRHDLFSFGAEPFTDRHELVQPYVRRSCHICDGLLLLLWQTQVRWTSRVRQAIVIHHETTVGMMCPVVCTYTTSTHALFSLRSCVWTHFISSVV
jgi:hypothetical protein